MLDKSADSRRSAGAGVRRVRVGADDAGQRLDNFLRRELPGVPKGRIYRMLRRGEVRINGGRAKPDRRLQDGDEVRIPPARLREPAPGPSPKAAQSLADRILHEDKLLIVIDKPSGMAVHGGSGISHGAIELMRALRPDLGDLSLVHRLDRDTSGCLVFAKRRSALRALHALFRDGRVEKNYLALVAGQWDHGDIVVDAPLLVKHRKNGERHVIVSAAGKEAETRIRLSRPYRGSSLVQCQPKTGRTHQIRVHAAHMGHAIAGDDRYGDDEANRAFADRGLGRLFLHAQSIAFPDTSGNELFFSAPLSSELDTFLSAL